MRTKIDWELNTYCTGGCSYCPSKFWGGEKPESLDKFFQLASHIINHYNKLGRKIDWRFTGGEPLEFFDLPAVMKMCKENEGTIELQTNGGKMWLDWFAIEPHVDRLDLTYHYWQNPNLIRFIIQAFHKKNKTFNISVPLRPDHFDEDLSRLKAIEDEFGISPLKMPLYKDAHQDYGLFPYTREQLTVIFGEQWVEDHFREKLPTREEIVQHRLETSPVFTGMWCNIGIEKLVISYDGWVKASHCNTLHCGNVWKGTLILPIGPTRCVRQSCMNGDDQQITKFSS